MKHLLRSIAINIAALWLTSQIIPGFSYNNGFFSLFIGGVAVMLINALVVPALKLMFLPLNLLTFGLFTWVINVVALYFLVAVVRDFSLSPYTFQGFNLSGFSVPAIDLNTLQVAVVASFIIGFSTNFIKWLVK